MEIYTRIVDKHLCIAHFSFTYKEAMHIYQNIEDNCDDAEFIEEEFLKTIEIDYLNPLLDERGIIYFGNKVFRLLSDLKENQPFVGVARFLVLPEIINLALPVEIPLSIKNQIEEKKEKVNQYFRLKLLENNYAQLEDVDVIDMDCIVGYDLRFIIDGEVISNYDNQILEMYKDDALKPERFIGAKVNDAVAISNVDGVVTDFLIKKIQKKIPYDKNTTKSLFEDMGYIDYNDLYQSYRKAFFRITKVQTNVDYIIDFIYQNTQIDYPSIIESFYKELDYFAYDKDYDFVSDEEEQKKFIHKSYIFDLLAKMVELKASGLLNDEIEMILDDYKNYHLNDDYDYYDLCIYSIKNRIYRYLGGQGIIK